MKDLFLKTILYGGCILCIILFIDFICYTVDMFDALSALSDLEKLGGEYVEELVGSLSSTKWELWRTLIVKLFTMLFVAACMVGFFQLDSKINRLYERKMDKPNQEPLDIGY